MVPLFCDRASQIDLCCPSEKRRSKLRRVLNRSRSFSTQSADSRRSMPQGLAARRSRQRMRWMAPASSHHWGRELTKLGHTVRLMPPMYVKPYVKRGKSDAVDAEAICEAVTRPTMRFVEIKSEDQQALLSLHRARDFVVRQRTQLINMLRSLAAEFGITIARGVARAID
ncbi:IS110 family transposase, partial [Rhodovulum sulfidophilum]